MKKFVCALLAATLLVGGAVSCAAEEYYTLPEIREQAAAGWHETYTDKYGRTIQVDIDIDVFGGNKAPVVKTDVPEFVELLDPANTNPVDSVVDVKRKGGQRTYLYHMHGEEVDLDKAYGADYGLDLTVRGAYDFLTERLEKNGQGYSVDDFILNTPQNFDVVYSKLVATGGVHVPALYLFRFWQQMHGLPILAGAEDGFYIQNTRSYVPWLSLDMRSEEDFYIKMCPLREVEVLVEDIPLCSVEKVIKSIESQIESGYIQYVYALRFGYAVYSDPEARDFRKYNTNMEDECYYLVPSWVVECVFSSNPKHYKQNAIDGEVEERYKFIINAQTGANV